MKKSKTEKLYIVVDFNEGEVNEFTNIVAVQKFIQEKAQDHDTEYFDDTYLVYEVVKKHSFEVVRTPQIIMG